jgi:hypothetical protein
MARKGAHDLPMERAQGAGRPGARLERERERMRIRPYAIAVISLVAVQQATAQQPQPSVEILAGAYDQCMTTSAVRLTRTSATDQDIYVRSTESCLPLKGRLRLAINAQLPAAQAADVLRAIDAQAEPNFMAMVARIRSDRARRGD